MTSLSHIHPLKEALEQLFILDPELAEKVLSCLMKKEERISPKDAATLVDETMWAMSLDLAFGELVALGYADLMGQVTPERLCRYRDTMRHTGERGLNLARIMAESFVPVLRYGTDALTDRFLEVVRLMRGKGEYTLRKPLSLLSSLLEKGDTETASAFLALLGQTFSQEMPFKRALHLAHLLPRAVQTLPASKRSWQMVQLGRVIQADSLLADSFMTAMEKSLTLLSQEALERFVSLGLEKFQRNPSLGAKFLSLESKLGIDAYTDMLVTVSLTQVREALNRYLRARTGLSIAIRPMSAMPGAFIPDGEEAPLACSDGRAIYLPDEISLFERKEENKALYKCLTRLESACYEFGTFDFDLDKAAQRFGFRLALPEENSEKGSDPERFFRLFPLPELASDLFTIFEQGRIRVLLGCFYPGILRQTFPMLIQEARRMTAAYEEPDMLTQLYRRVALGEALAPDERFYADVQSVKERFEQITEADIRVETCAELVLRTYPEAEKHVRRAGYRPLKTPFGRKLRPDLFFASFQHFEETARKIRVRLAEKDLNAYKSDIRKQLMENNGSLSPDDLKEIVFSPGDHQAGEPAGQAEMAIDLSWLDLSDILGQTGADVAGEEATGAPVFWYGEWDMSLGDYLHDHVRVSDRFVPEATDDFYDETLKQYRGLVTQLRYAFELLRPEGLTILRQWVEGDEFDYRALLDFAVDRKAGLMPSDRLYIKRIKQERDVAVMLLVDLSKSTSNQVFGSEASVLDLEKEAIVLFCEALQVVGDAFAIAGFSGTGRLGVDYFRIKDFEEPVEETVRGRISGMAPQRSTRMGGAIRHATAQLVRIPAKVRILIILGDGFPNDTDYKREYAIADTRKSIAEARAKNIHARAITVNITGDSKLDDLYGSLHHNVISDVRELPDRLLRIYSALTK